MAIKSCVLTKTQIQKFRDLYLKKFAVELDETTAGIEAQKLLRVYSICLENNKYEDENYDKNLRRRLPT